MFKNINNLFHKWWFVLLYALVWSIGIFVPLAVVQNKEFKKRNGFI